VAEVGGVADAAVAEAGCDNMKHAGNRYDDKYNDGTGDHVDENEQDGDHNKPGGDAVAAEDAGDVEARVGAVATADVAVAGPSQTVP
jgi:hypothetical protein